MHERTIVRDLLDQIPRLVPDRPVRAVRVVKLTVGEFSGVEPELVRLAFEELAPSILHPQVRIDVIVVPLLADCRSCRRRFRVQNFRFRCPDCDGQDVVACGGEQIELTSLTFEESDASSREQVIA
jgi:hydrogenase nickel incorporation protein HypA/HybF